MRKKKKIIHILSFLIIVSMNTTIIHSETNQPHIMIDSLTISSGDLYYSSLFVRGVSDLTILSLNVTWDTDIINVTDVDTSNLYSDFDSVFISLDTVNGFISIDAYKFGDEGLSGNISVLRLSIVAVEPLKDGTISSLDISDKSTMYDSDQEFIEHSTQSGQIIIKSNEDQNNDNGNNGNNNGVGNPHLTNNEPIAIIQVSPTIELIGVNITFNASNSFDPDGDNLTFLWDFKDGITSNKKLISHNYKTPGSYDITLTVEDQKGGSDTTIKTIKILPPGNHPPQNLNVSFESIYVTQKEPMILKITAEEYDLQDTIKYIIDWGDGTSTISDKKDSGEIYLIQHNWSSYGKYKLEICAKDESNTSSAKNTYTIFVDVIEIDNIIKGWLIDSNGDGIYDELNMSNTTIKTIKKQDDNYLISITNNGSWEYIYHISSGLLEPYGEEKEMKQKISFYSIIGITIIMILLFILIILIYKKFKT